LYLTWADDYGGSAVKKPSRFLLELGLVEKPAKSAPSGEVFFVKQPVLPKLSVKLQVPETFSFSGINCFNNCPLEYKYRYIYQLPLPGAAQLSFGDTIHKTLEKFLKTFQQINTQPQADLFGTKKTGLEVPKQDLILKFYEECWVDDWYQDKIQKENYRKLGHKMLENFYDRFAENPKPVKFLEQRFKLKIEDYKFVGKIDRGDLNPDGSLDIIDYKTGQVKEKISGDDKTQLLVYQWAAQEEFKEKIHSLRYWYLSSLRDSVEFLGTAQEIEEVKEKILTTIKRIIEAIESNSFMELDRKKSHTCKFRHLEG